ncbi:hypothetical protein KKH13_02650 [Patescibacteria group bacterium]|nr:hypothetical protein [Patescibacteria group bacterium]
MPSTIEGGVEYIEVPGQNYSIAVPPGFLNEADKAQAAEIGLIPGRYADGTVVKRDGTIIRPSSTQTST